jgi:hypothetical protein
MHDAEQIHPALHQMPAAPQRRAAVRRASGLARVDLLAEAVHTARAVSGTPMSYAEQAREVAEMGDFPCLVRFVPGSDQVRYRLGERLVDRYLEFMAGRCRPNTLGAVAFDLKAFFAVTGKDPVEVTAVAAGTVEARGCLTGCGSRRVQERRDHRHQHVGAAGDPDV